MDKEFRAAKDILDGVADAERNREKDLLKRADWDDPLDVALYAQQTRAQGRLKVLHKLVPKRICRVCGSFKPGSRSWVVNKKGTDAVCRSCFHCNLQDNRVDNITLNRTLFGTPELRYPISGFALSAARQEAGISKYQFANKAGWTYPYQCRIEAGKVLSVTDEVAYVILGVFHQYRVRTKDTI